MKKQGKIFSFTFSDDDNPSPTDPDPLTSVGVEGGARRVPLSFMSGASPVSLTILTND